MISYNCYLTFEVNLSRCRKPNKLKIKHYTKMRNNTINLRNEIILKERTNLKNKKASREKGKWADYLAPYQSAYAYSRTDLFYAYTVYYVIKHDLFNKGLADEYLEKVANHAHKQLQDEWSRGYFKKYIKEEVLKYESEEYGKEIIRVDQPES